MNGSIKNNLDRIRASLPSDGSVTLVAVSKFQPVESILEAYEAGQRIFAESRVDELERKATVLPDDIEWHFIGHLQTNKAERLLRVPGLKLIQSVDSLRLLELIDRISERNGTITRLLLELHVAMEETKYGFQPSELIEWFDSGGLEGLRATHVYGLMGMASNIDDEKVVKNDFKRIRLTFDAIKDNNPDIRGFDTLSMGMSGDYRLAIEEGSTMVRIGSDIFGPRG